MVKVDLLRNGMEAEARVSGRIDSNSAKDLEDALLSVADRFDTVTLDFEKVPYISSAGLRAIGKLHRKMREKNGRMIIRKVRKDVLDVFQVTGFCAVFEIEE